MTATTTTAAKPAENPFQLPAPDAVIVTASLIQLHTTQLILLQNELPNIRAMVQNGQLGNAGHHETKIRLHKEAMKQLIDAL